MGRTQLQDCQPGLEPAFVFFPFRALSPILAWNLFRGGEDVPSPDPCIKTHYWKIPGVRGGFKKKKSIKSTNPKSEYLCSPRDGYVLGTTLPAIHQENKIQLRPVSLITAYQRAWHLSPWLVHTHFPMAVPSWWMLSFPSIVYCPFFQIYQGTNLGQYFPLTPSDPFQIQSTILGESFINLCHIYSLPVGSLKLNRKKLI